MPDYVLPASPVPSIAVVGSEDRFPVRRILCVGRNYADHALEMGGDPDREPPFFFSKPADSVVPAAGTVPYPPATARLEHEVELVVAIGDAGAGIPRERALDHVWGYAAGVDLTRRDLQQTAKELRRPWDAAKGFDASAPLTPLRRAADVPDPGRGRIWLSVNGEPRQSGDLAEMIWPVADVVAFASQLWELRAGDLIFTGTPSGVGRIDRGDAVAGGIEGVGEFGFTVG